MSFDYNKNKKSHSEDSFWTSYSDLFLGLSAIFLLLYVTASLRTGTDTLKVQVENQKLSMKVEEMQNQLKMYESVKENYMEKEAAKDEVAEYQELMDKLTLLEEESKDEKTRLAKQALENESKAKALNKYQQMVRNVLNANKVAKSRIITRGEVIGEQIEEIDQQKNEINDLEQDVASKKQMIADNESKIAKAEQQLKKNLADLNRAYKANKMTKKSYDKKMVELKKQNDQKISSLEMVNKQFEQQIQDGNQKISQLGEELSSTQTQLEGTKNQLEGTKTQLAGTLNQLQGARTNLKTAMSELSTSKANAAGLGKALAAAGNAAENLKGEMEELKDGFGKEKAAAQAAFNDQLGKMKLSAAQRAAKEGEFRAAAAQKEKALNSQLSGLQGQLRETEGALAKAKEEMDTRKAVADEIRRGFAKAGVKADIDMQTGEVVLDFGDAYFESDSAKIKPEMRNVLEKAMPAYSHSLFGNPKVSKKISSVEIVGFASPTYQGRYIDPSSKKPEDRAALKYNMDLSYRRANAIFGHLIDGKKEEFSHRQELLSLMKVSGRSFLEVMNIQNRNVATAAEFCKLNDCKKAQKVIIRFSMEGK